MKKNCTYQLLLIAVLITVSCWSNAETICPVIPKPVHAQLQKAVFILNSKTALVVNDESLQPVAHYLQQQLMKDNKLSLTEKKTVKKSIIKLLLTQENSKNEAYSLSISANEINISASHTPGVFYGVVSLLQLISQSSRTDKNISLNCWNIADAPQYEWRGLMLDESRHFFGMEKVKSILDWMAFYKLNRFHWHLTDEPAWRIEIKKYPKLALVGGIGTYTNPANPAQFYTQQQVAEIVQYAARLYITVIPEIDMPGHATAANRAYPQYSGGGSAKHPDFTFHPGKEETYTYLSNILRETHSLFPSGMLHVGGDEVSFGNEKWAADSLVQQVMRKEKLADVKAVEHYFMKRIADSVFSINATVLAWDEVAEVDLPVDKTILFWWRHDQPSQLQKVLNKGYKVVLCPRLPLYFDFVQDSTHTAGRKWNKSFNSIRNVYAFGAETLPGITIKNKQQVLGIQANVWTETMPTVQRLDYMLFPRIAALAEAAWASSKDYLVFKTNLQKHLQLYKQAGINFYHPF